MLEEPLEWVNWLTDIMLVKSWGVYNVDKVHKIQKTPSFADEAFNAWCGAGSNRRHKDFQSFALPTELPHLILCPISASSAWSIPMSSGPYFSNTPSSCWKTTADWAAALSGQIRIQKSEIRNRGANICSFDLNMNIYASSFSLSQRRWHFRISSFKSSDLFLTCLTSRTHLKTLSSWSSAAPNWSCGPTVLPGLAAGKRFHKF